METERFDTLTKAPATSADSRRAAFRLLVGGALGPILGSLGVVALITAGVSMVENTRT